MAEGTWILLVDDDADDQYILKTAFDECHLPGEITFASTGIEALKILHNCSPLFPDLILLDLNMPIMDGREFLSKVKEDPLFQDIPVIIYSTSSYQKDIADSERLGASAYCIKPLWYDEIIRMVMDLVSRDWVNSEFMIIK